MANIEPENFVFVVCDSEDSNVGHFMRVYTTREMAEKVKTKYQLLSSKKFIIRRVPIDYLDIQ
jgi:hypothetical protein